MLGKGYEQQGAHRNDVDFTNVPMIREKFRWQQLEDERKYFDAMVDGSADQLLSRSADIYSSMTAAESRF